MFCSANLQPSRLVKGSNEVYKLQLKIEMALWNLISVASKGAGPGTYMSCSMLPVSPFSSFYFSPWILSSTSVLNLHRKAGG